MEPRTRNVNISYPLIERLYNSLKAGNYLEIASQLCGLSTIRLRNWIRKGAELREILDDGGELTDEDLIYVVLVERIEEAQAKAEDELVQAIQSRANTDWKAASWLLERRNPIRWGYKPGNSDMITGETSKKDALPVNISMETLRKIINMSAEQKGGEAINLLPHTFLDETETKKEEPIIGSGTGSTSESL